jgi:hypothetical protein
MYVLEASGHQKVSSTYADYSTANGMPHKEHWLDIRCSLLCPLVGRHAGPSITSHHMQHNKPSQQQRNHNAPGSTSPASGRVHDNLIRRDSDAWRAVPLVLRLDVESPGRLHVWAHHREVISIRKAGFHGLGAVSRESGGWGGAQPSYAVLRCVLRAPEPLAPLAVK